MQTNISLHSTHTTAKAPIPTWADGVCRISAEFIKANRKFASLIVVMLSPFRVFTFFAAPDHSISGGEVNIPPGKGVL